MCLKIGDNFFVFVHINFQTSFVSSMGPLWTCYAKVYLIADARHDVSALAFAFALMVRCETIRIYIYIYINDVL